MSGKRRATRRKPPRGTNELPASFWPLATSSGKKTSSETSEIDTKRRKSSSDDSDFLTVSSGLSFDDLLLHESPSLVTVEAHSFVQNSANPGPSDSSPRTWSFYPQTDKSTKGKDDYRLKTYVPCVPNSCLFLMQFLAEFRGAMQRLGNFLLHQVG